MSGIERQISVSSLFYLVFHSYLLATILKEVFQVTVAVAKWCYVRIVQKRTTGTRVMTAGSVSPWTVLTPGTRPVSLAAFPSLLTQRYKCAAGLQERNPERQDDWLWHNRQKSCLPGKPESADPGRVWQWEKPPYVRHLVPVSHTSEAALLGFKCVLSGLH